MPSAAQLAQLERGYPEHLAWAPAPELHNRLEELASVADHEIAAEDTSLAPPAAEALAALTAAVAEVLPQYLAEHAVTVWLIQRTAARARLAVVDAVRIAAEPVPRIGLGIGQRPELDGRPER